MKALTYTVEDAAFNYCISWNPEDEPEAIRLGVHPQAPLKGDTLDAMAETLIRGRSAVEQPQRESQGRSSATGRVQDEAVGRGAREGPSLAPGRHPDFLDAGGVHTL